MSVGASIVCQPSACMLSPNAGYVGAAPVFGSRRQWFKGKSCFTTQAALSYREEGAVCMRSQMHPMQSAMATMVKSDIMNCDASTE